MLNAEDLEVESVFDWLLKTFWKILLILNFYSKQSLLIRFWSFLDCLIIQISSSDRLVGNRESSGSKKVLPGRFF